MDSNIDPTSLPEQHVPDDSEASTPTRVDVFRSALSPVPQKHPKKRLLVISLTIIVLVVAIGFGGHWLLSGGHKSTPTYKAPAQTVANTAKSPSGGKATSTAGTNSYTAADFNLSFNYPDGWTVFNNGSGPMTVTSPTMLLTSATGQKVNGLVTMTIQQQGQLPAAFSAGTALAVLNSQLIPYKNPSSAQTSQTYLSFVQYSSTTTKGGLDAIYVTGNYGYQKDGIIPSSNIASINPLVTISFTKCGNTKCTASLTSLTIASTAWSNKTFQTPIKNMLASLDFQ